MAPCRESKTSVKVNEVLSESSEVHVGIHRELVLSPLLFIIMLEEIS